MRIDRWAVLCVVALLSGSAFAATYVVPHDEVLVRQADLIVVARATSSFVEESDSRGIQTTTLLSIEEILKGNVSLMAPLSVHEPGGVLDDRHIKMIPGVPRFSEGERVLVFLKRIPGGGYAVLDLALGVFRYATDDLGHKVLMRNEAEIYGWDPDGAPHRERRRDAEKFTAFIREVVRGRDTQPDYTIESRPLVGDPPVEKKSRASILTCTGCTVTQYTLGDTESSNGFRWKVFPTAVNWNRGNTIMNVGNSGSDAITAAFAAWNGDANSNVNLVLASTVSDTDGILEAADARNNVVFEKDLTSIGAPAFSCSTGGVLGYGGVSAAFADGTNVVGSEQFFRIDEGDVSMNQGVEQCIGTNPGITLVNFERGVTHEIGHSLGFRHADQNRSGMGSCASGTNYDCDTVAIMTSVVTGGTTVTLEAWDTRAVRALYPGVAVPSAPTNLVATGTAVPSVTLTWTASSSGSPTSYNVYRKGPGNTAFTLVGSPATNSFTDTTMGMAINVAFLYKVRGVNAGGESADSNLDLATTVIFTDDPLVANVTPIKATHMKELRLAVDAVQTLAGQTPTAYTDDPPVVGVTPVKAVHITELRTRLNSARAALGLSAATFTNTITASVSLVRALDFQEIRTGVK